MSADLQVPYSDGGDYKREYPSIGEHQAVLSQIHNLGHQLFKGVPSISPKVSFIFEIDQKIQEGKFAGKQMVIAKEFSMYFSKENELRSFIENWRGAPLTDDQAKNYNLSKLLHQPATLIIVHNTSNGKTYANIAGIARAKTNFPKVEVTYLETPDWIIKKKEASVPAPSRQNNTAKPEQEPLAF